MPVVSLSYSNLIRFTLDDQANNPGATVETRQVCWLNKTTSIDTAVTGHLSCVK